MTLRSSYGTLMMKSFGDFPPTHDEIAFLEIMAMQMNTRTEQLRSTYIGIDHTDYLATAKGLVRALAVTNGTQETEDADVGDEGDLAGFFT